MARCQSSWQPPSPRVHASVMPVPGHDPGIDPAILDVGTAADAFSLSIAHPAVIRLHHPSPHPEEVASATVSKVEGVSRMHWILLRDAASRLLLRMRPEGGR